MNHLAATLSWQGHSHTPETLQEFALQQLAANPPDWQRDLYQVVADWLNPDVRDMQAFTSGSTGTPRPISFSKASMATSARLTAERFGLGEGSRALLCLPAKFIAGKMMIIRALVNGWDLYPVETTGSPLELAPNELDFAAMIPLQVHRSLVEQPEKFAKIGQVIIGGAPIPAGTMDLIQASPTSCFATYGMTETLTHLAIRAVNGPNASEWFETLPGVALSLDERECLHIEADHLPEPVQTNDLVELGPGGHFRWLGRYDHVINSGGVKISPEQVEPKLQAMIAQRFYLIGEADERLGQKVVLVVEGDPWTDPEITTFYEQAKLHLDRFEVPKELRFVEQLEETVTGKVRRR